MCDNVVCARPSVTYVAARKLSLQTSYSIKCRAWHVLGSLPCDSQSPTCSSHYGLCLPVLTQLLDEQTHIGVLDVDVNAVKDILWTNHTSSAPRSQAPSPSRRSLQSSPLSRNLRRDSPEEAGPTSRTVAELATPKRVGHLTSGPNTHSSPNQLKSSPRNSAVNLFSIELMQTDDVSTIAAQIANQAELIYQAWKTTDLNPAELIHYHSVSADRSSPFRTSSPFQSSNSPTSPSSSTSSVPRIPVRSISPAPLGSSPAIPRRVIDIPISTADRSPPSYQKQQSPQISSPSQQPHSYVQSPQYVQPQQLQKQFQQPHQSLHQQQLLQQQLVRQQLSSPSPSLKSLNVSPRPYIPPLSASDFAQSAPQSPKLVSSSPSSPNVYSEMQPSRSFGSTRMALSQPPPPPERSSSYVEGVQTGTPTQVKSSPKDVEMIGNPDLEASLRELVTNFVMEDKARLASTRDRPKSAPSSIQDALQRFERQMAITSRVTNDVNQNHDLLDATFPANTEHIMGSPSTNAPQPSHFSTPKKYGGVRSDSSISEGWNKREADGRARRSISPSPHIISQPGWNEPPPSNTSTWPLKHKQPGPPDKRSTSELLTALQQSSPIQNQSPIVSSPPVVTSQTNYITTLEAHVDSQGRSPGIPIRHKIITMSGTNRDDDMTRTFKKISQDEVDSIRSKDMRVSLPSSSVTSTTSTVARGVSTSRRKPKYTISVTVDVENKMSSPEPPISNLESVCSQSWQTANPVENLSTVDYAKVRFQDAQQRPKTAQRLEDYKTYSSKTTVNGDGRVLQAKSKFEVGNSLMSPTYQEAPWRTIPASSLTTEVGSTLPEFYRRKLRKMRKTNSPEPFHALAALPHPELTDQQKAHIRERSQIPSAALGGNVVVRPFLTQGSVAERVLLFEKAPTELNKTASPAVIAEKKRPAFSTWRDPDEVRSKAQETIPAPLSPPRQHLEALPSSAPTITANTTTKQSHLREPITSIANKENARPAHCVPTHVSGTPTATVITHPSAPSALSTNAHNNASPSVGLGVHGGMVPTCTSTTTTRTASRRITKTPKNLLIPRFYYPMGRPHQSQEEALDCVTKCFREFDGQIQRDNIEPLMRACQLPLYWKAPLFIAAGGEKLGYLTLEQFIDYWERVISTCHDASSRFVRVLSRGLRNFLLPEDFLSLVQDVVDTHPGLTFLKEATEFHSRYVHTVIARVYYCVNRSWSGKITIPEIRRSNLLQVISYLEEEEDINKITDYFSYEHFYVIYCKFWELDADHDLFIDRNDLAKHNERALSDKIIDRIFSGAVTRGRVQKQDRMGYQEFVWFLISEEDKRHPTAIEYWFRCMDIDGDGFLSMYELEYFYEDQLQRMEALGIETLPYTDCLCQMLDMVRPSVPGKISLNDLKKCRMTTVFFDTFFNFDKYLDHEQRDPFASHRMDDDGPEISDWDRYAAEEYELLVAEEGGGDPQDDMLYDDEDELSMGVDNALDADGLMGPEFGVLGGKDLAGMGIGVGLSKHSSLSATVPNLAIDHMDVDDDYADSDDYQY